MAVAGAVLKSVLKTKLLLKYFCLGEPTENGIALINSTEDSLRQTYSFP
jgi:hypothetical protein